MNYTNRKWQNHFKSKGFVPFMYDRLMAYSINLTTQYKNNHFDFSCNENEENLLVKYFFEFAEEFPYEIYIESTNHCNLNCVFCARKNMKREFGFMSMELFQKIIDEIAEKRPFAHVHLYGIGEPTVDSLVIEKINYAIKKGVTNLVLFTNGKNLLKDDLYKKLVDTSIGTIGVDFDGFSKEVYEKVRLGGNFEDVKEGIISLKKYIQETDSQTRLELAYQIYEGINDHEVDQFTNWANENGYEYKLVPMHNWAGLREDIPVGEHNKPYHMKRERPCSALWSSQLIFWNGDVSVCFFDADGREIKGNVKESSIEEVWVGEQRKKRKEHIKGQFTNLCANCKDNCCNRPPPFNSPIYPKILRE